MENVIEWLREARGEIIAGLVLALLGWLYSRYRSFMKMYRLKKKELERMENDMFRFGNTKKEIESLQEALKESEAQRQDVKNQLEALQRELQRKDEALRESEAKPQNESRRIETLQQELQRIKAEKQRQAMKDKEFLELCESGNAQKVEEAIMNGANVNARRDNGFTALILATIGLNAETVRVLLDYGAYFNAKDNDGLTALAWAEYYGYTGIANLLRSYGAR